MFWFSRFSATMDMGMMSLKNSAVFLWNTVLWCFTFLRFTLVSLLENVDYKSYGDVDILGQPITIQKLTVIIGGLKKK